MTILANSTEEMVEITCLLVMKGFTFEATERQGTWTIRLLGGF